MSVFLGDVGFRRALSLIAALGMSIVLTCAIPRSALAEITVVRLGTGSDPASAVGEGDLDTVMQAAADYYNRLFGGYLGDIVIEYGWDDAGSGPIASESSNRITFSDTANWFMDATPFQNEEFLYESGGLEAQYYDSAGYIGSDRQLFAQGEAIGNHDAFSYALHEMAHSLGFKNFLSSSYTIESGFLYGVEVPLEGDDLLLGLENPFKDHFPQEGLTEDYLLSGAPGVSVRVLPNSIELSIIAEQLGIAHPGENYEHGLRLKAGNVEVGGYDDIEPGLVPLPNYVADSTTIDGKFSGLGLFDVGDYSNLGDTIVRNGGNLDIINSLNTRIPSLSVSNGSTVTIANAGFLLPVGKVEIESGSTLDLIDGGIWSKDRTWLNGVGVDITDSTVNFKAKDYDPKFMGIHVTDGEINVHNSKLNGAVSLSAKSINFTGADTEIDIGFSPGSAFFSGNVTMSAGTILLEDLFDGTDQLFIDGDFLIGADVMVSVFVDEFSATDLFLDIFFPTGLPVFESGFGYHDGFSLFSENEELLGMEYSIFFGDESKKLYVEAIPAATTPVPGPPAIVLLFSALFLLAKKRRWPPVRLAAAPAVS